MSVFIAQDHIGTADILNAAGAAAKVAHDLEDADKHVQREKPRKILDAAARLEAVLEINRKLHESLREKKGLADEVNKACKGLKAKLAGRAVEEPLRKAKVDELQAGSQKVERTPHAVREMAILTRDVNRLQENVEAINTHNIEYAAAHREDRGKLTEVHSRMRTLGRRERELASKLEWFAHNLNEVLWSSEDMRPDVEVKDFRHIPGLQIGKLVARGKDAHGEEKEANKAKDAENASGGAEQRAPQAAESPKAATGVSESPVPKPPSSSRPTGSPRGPQRTSSKSSNRSGSGSINRSGRESAATDGSAGYPPSQKLPSGADTPLPRPASPGSTTPSKGEQPAVLPRPPASTPPSSRRHVPSESPEA